MGNGLDSISCLGKSFTRSGQTLVADLSDCVSLATISKLRYCSDQDQIVATIKDGFISTDSVEMAILEPRWATGTFLGRTDESDEVIVETAAGIGLFRRRTNNKQWERDVFTTFIGALESQRFGGGGSSGKQQAAIHHEGTHFNSMARHQAARRACELLRSTQQSAGRGSCG